MAVTFQEKNLRVRNLRVSHRLYLKLQEQDKEKCVTFLSPLYETLPRRALELAKKECLKRVGTSKPQVISFRACTEITGKVNGHSIANKKPIVILNISYFGEELTPEEMKEAFLKSKNDKNVSYSGEEWGVRSFTGHLYFLEAGRTVFDINTLEQRHPSVEKKRSFKRHRQPE
jgi:hypothetical protein